MTQTLVVYAVVYFTGTIFLNLMAMIVTIMYFSK